MHKSELDNKKIAILGFGIEGQAVGRYLSGRDLEFSVLDKNFKAQWQNDFPNAKFETGRDYLDKITNFNVIFRSPGVHYLHRQIQQAKKDGAIITSQIKFFTENCPAKIIGVTGTKGKGTTAKLLYDILKAAKIPAYLAGNIGTEALVLLEKLSANDYVILELSSYQLQDLELSPHIAVVLMVVPEHLDVHNDFEEYLAAKSSITKYQGSRDFAVINFNSEGAMRVGKEGSAKKYFIQTLAKEDISVKDPFAIYDPLQFLKIKDGFFSEELHGQIYFVENGNASAFTTVKEIPLRGFHNLQNITAAAMAAKILEIKDNEIIDAIKNYNGLEHRLEFVAEIAGVKYYNDSYGTTPQSSIAAIKSFSEPVIAIIGGADKKADYAEFGKELAKQKNLKAICLIGEIAEKIETGIIDGKYNGKVFKGSKNMPEIFAQISAVAEKGDVVLLAPGSSSFGMFENYSDRGNKFKAEVQKIG